MKKEVDFKVDAKIENDLPNIIIYINYKDDFSDDNYKLISNSNKEVGSKKIEFSVIKNGEEIGKIDLISKDFNLFFEDFLKLTEDYDFKKEFLNISNYVKQELEKFFVFFNDAIILTGVTLEGELKRMKKLSGLLNG